jgi:hypothetical protein
VRAHGVSLSGVVVDAGAWDVSPSRVVALSAPVADDSLDGTSGSPSGSVSAGTTTSWTFGTTEPGGVALSQGHQILPVTGALLTVTVTRGAASEATQARHSFSGSFAVTTASGTETGTVAGEALFDGAVWRLRGTSSLTVGADVMGNGGFAADVAVRGAGNADDRATWQFDTILR